MNSRLANRFFVFLTFLTLIISLIIWACVAMAQPETEIIIYPGEQIEIKKIEGEPTILPLNEKVKNINLSPSDTFCPAGLLKLFSYKDLGIDFLADWNGQIIIIDVYSHRAKTQEGVRVGDDFSVMEKVYGSDFRKIMPAYGRTIVYDKIGIIFHGAAESNKISAISICPPKFARYTRYIRISDD